MKRILSFLLCMGLVVLHACKLEPDPYLSVSPDSLAFPQEGGSQTVRISANNAWTASISGSGFSLSASSGTGDASLTVTAAAASAADPSSGTLTVSSSGLSASVKLTQDAKSVILVGDSATIPAEGGTYEVAVQYNTDFSVEVESSAQSWITFVKTKALQNGKLEFNFAANENTEPRTGKVTIRDNSGKVSPLTITFIQEEKKVIHVGETAIIPAEGGSFEVDVQYNTDFTVEVEASAQSWITFVKTKAVQNGKLEFQFAANETTEPRTGKATVKDNSGKVNPMTITFVQEKKVEVESVTLDRDSAEIEAGESLQLTATIAPHNAYDKTVTWSSDKETVAMVDENGLVTGIAIGEAIITAKAGGKIASCTIIVSPSAYEKERSALIALYNATGGDNWKHKDNWCSDKPLNEWYGILTDDDTSEGRVTVVALSSNGLSGEIPPELFSIPELLSLNLSSNNLTGSIPVEIGNAKTLSMLDLESNNLSGTIPESLYQLPMLHRISLWSNKLSGELSEQFWDMPALDQLSLDNNKFTGRLTSAVGKAKHLQWLGLGSNFLEGTIPEEIIELKDLKYFNIGNKTQFNTSFTEAANNFSGVIPNNLDKLQNLEYFLVGQNNLEGSIPTCFARMPNLRCLELYANRLSGAIAEELVACDNWDIWAPDANIMPQQKGYTLSFSYYESRDYSQDGKVIKLQTHENGNGINIVITGDCFTDQDIDAGLFETIARQTMEDFFSIEPFTTFRNLFDVYAVVTVSKTRYSDYGTALGAIFGEDAYVYCDEDKVKAYSLKAVSNLDETLTIVIVNKNRNSGTAFMPVPKVDTDFGSGFSYACFGLQAENAARRLLINHEANGHGFTKLQDEYFYSGGSAYPEDNKQYIRDTYFSKGYFANVDFESDPRKVKWSKFLFDDRYQYDGLGVFEGGMTVSSGVWRPSENSVMGRESEFNGGDRFNAPSRAAAYIRIHKLAYGSSWVFDYEEFVKYDAINRKTSASSSPAQAQENCAKRAVPHTPPVFMKRPGAR